MNDNPTVFHITHQKAGSQWIDAILQSCVGDRYIPKQVQGFHYKRNAIAIGGVYSCVYLSKPDFEAILGASPWLHYFNREDFRHSPQTYIANWYHFQIQKKNHRKFIIIRDLRDTLVSAYFSFKISHAPLTDNLLRWRKNLQNMDKERGLLYLMDERLEDLANIQTSWIDSDALVFKYEELLQNQYELIEKIVDDCQIEIDRDRLHEIIRENSFEAMAGRKQGQENIASHQRKGVAGDWQNHFSDAITAEFKRRFGEVLIKTGYEKDLNW